MIKQEENNTLKEKKEYELIKFEDGDFSLDVSVSPSEDTVWLTQNEMAILFDVNRTRITRHVNNIINEGKLPTSVCAENALTANDGKTYITKIYNLDMIISVGYRVNSKRGVMFRKWANSILKQYLTNGYAINADRILAYQSNILQLEANYINIENRLRNIEQTVYTDNNLILFEGEIIEPYSFLVKLFFLAKERIIITDNYADQFLLDMLKNIAVSITIYTLESALINKCELKDNIIIINTNVFHDRYIIIDDNTYLMGTSFNSIGKKRFTISKLEDITAEMLLKNIENTVK